MQTVGLVVNALRERSAIQPALREWSVRREV
jgi:hypothetical protein